MKPLILILMVAALMVSPVMGYSSTYTAPDGKALEIITWRSDIGTTGTYTIYQANGDTVTGSWGYTETAVTILPYHATGTIGSDTKTFTYILPGSLTTAVWSGDNVSNTMKMRMGYGQTAGIYNSVMETDITGSPIVKYTITANQDITEDQILVPYAAADAAMSATSGEGYIEKALGFFLNLWTILLSIMFWIKFLFVDNIVMIVCLYLFGTMAYAINTSKNIFAFFTTWFRQQSRFFSFVVSVFSAMISALGSIIQSFKPL